MSTQCQPGLARSYSVAFQNEHWDSAVSMMICAQTISKSTVLNQGNISTSKQSFTLHPSIMFLQNIFYVRNLTV